MTLKATFEHTEEFEFQDEVGRLLLEVSSVVPGGVLCFMPSYKLLDKMFNRWTTTGQIDIISRRKLVVLEPRSGEQLRFVFGLPTFSQPASPSHFFLARTWTNFSKLSRIHIALDQNVLGRFFWPFAEEKSPRELISLMILREL